MHVEISQDDASSKSRDPGAAPGKNLHSSQIGFVAEGTCTAATRRCIAVFVFSKAVAPFRGALAHETCRKRQKKCNAYFLQHTDRIIAQGRLGTLEARKRANVKIFSQIGTRKKRHHHQREEPGVLLMVWSPLPARDTPSSQLVEASWTSSPEVGPRWW